MAEAAILDFSKFSISDEIFQFMLCQGICFQISAKELNPRGSY